ncbi:ADP-ribosylglycohydrolase family protein [Levilactobacillus tongjiangensis]|uniref:ADP-ribosylglycohydrolase family protein n=1 Tax=Levilactobacillus tongjiangensis TaxID=2486023 RepID=A0ABW1SSR6_9LACO|nr:ADP-ribosylglycohydrolase family protein [Levilactobacillus tongjiangensis]
MNYHEIMNGLQWAAVADALGVPAEMQERGTYPVITEMQPSSFWEQPAGSWSDDTSMTLCLLENIVAEGDYTDMMQRLERYMRFGTDTPRGELFDVGRTCAHAVRNYVINGITPLMCGDASPEANGNGALMRIAPLAIVLQHETNQNRRFELIRDYTVLTHRHARSVVASFIFLELLHSILNGMSLGEAIPIVQISLAKFFKDTEYAEELQYYQMMFDPDFSHFPVEAIKTSGYVVDTLMAAVWLALNQPAPKDAILKAVNLGGDTDTIATVVASLVAAGQPTVSVDATWWGQLLNTELLEQRFTAFATKYAET